MTLSEILTNPAHKDAIIADCVTRVEARVAAASGLKGMSLRAGLGAIKKARPDAVPRAVTKFLPEFAAALDPLYARFRASGERDFAAYVKRHSREAREALMSITDARAETTQNAALAAGYKRLRGMLASELEQMLPELLKGVSARIGQERQ